jgi:hypothetical protein
MFIVLLLYYWLLVLASQGHHQANIYNNNKKTKMLVHIAQKWQLYGIPFTLISGRVIIVKTTIECKWDPIK